MNKKKIIIILRLIFAVGTVMIYLMLYKPLISDIGIMKEDFELVKSEYEAKQIKLGTLKATEEKLGILEEEIERMVSRYYGKTAQEELIVKIYDFCRESQVRLLELKYNGAKEFTIETPAVEETEENAEESLAENIEENTIYGESFSVSFAGTYEEILKMLNLIDKNEKIIVNMGLEINIELNTTTNIPEELKAANPGVDFEAMMNQEGELSCQVELIFFQVEGLEAFVENDDNILKKEPQEKSTSENPFAVYIDELLKQYGVINE